MLHNIEQGSTEWLKLRLGRVGGSESSPFFSYMEKIESVPKGLESLAIQKVAERLLQELPDDQYESEAMAWGKMYEPYARKAYEREYFATVETPGYYSFGDWFGYSPDGQTEDRLIEIKCPSAKKWIEFAYKREIPKEHIAQMYWGMDLTGIDKCDYLVYHPQLGLLKAEVEQTDIMKTILKTRKNQYLEIVEKIILAIDKIRS